jgi:hypothetical protein
MAGGPVSEDPRWIRFNAEEVPCSCGNSHKGLFPINMMVPAGWPHAHEYAPDENVVMEGDFLSQNFCVREGKWFAARARLPLQMRGAPPWSFTYTVWIGLNRGDFEGYVMAVRSGSMKDGARASARLVNRLAGYPDTANLMGTVFQTEDGNPPVLLVHGEQPDNRFDHPILAEQRSGIDFDRALELFAAYGHDMRPSFS